MTFPEKLQDSVLDVAKIGAAAFGGLYALGFTVVEIHLGRYHVAPYGLVRAQYLLAGVWSLAPFVAITICVVWATGNYFDRTMTQNSGTPAKSNMAEIVRTIRRGALALMVTVGGLWTLVRMFMRIVPELTSELGQPDFLFIAVYLLKAAAFGIVTFVFGAGAMFMAFKVSRERHSTEDIVVAAFAGTLAILTWAAYLFHFALTAYPRIPGVFGGGDGQMVVAISEISASADTPVDRKTSRVAAVVGDSPCQLLLETDKAYVLLHLKTQRVMVVNKDKIAMLVFARRVVDKLQR